MWYLFLRSCGSAWGYVSCADACLVHKRVRRRLTRQTERSDKALVRQSEAWAAQHRAAMQELGPTPEDAGNVPIGLAGLLASQLTPTSMCQVELGPTPEDAGNAAMGMAGLLATQLSPTSTAHGVAGLMALPGQEGAVARQRDSEEDDTTSETTHSMLGGAMAAKKRHAERDAQRRRGQEAESGASQDSQICDTEEGDSPPPKKPPAKQPPVKPRAKQPSLKPPAKQPPLKPPASKAPAQPREQPRVGHLAFNLVEPGQYRNWGYITVPVPHDILHTVQSHVFLNQLSPEVACQLFNSFDANGEAVGNGKRLWLNNILHDMPESISTPMCVAVSDLNAWLQHELAWLGCGIQVATNKNTPVWSLIWNDSSGIGEDQAVHIDQPADSHGVAPVMLIALQTSVSFQSCTTQSSRSG
mmetsp:Transcript_4818/g.14617  ORF Transcript_4818/g.14617 Transcript_4818/m.14617 type:complete len:414 (-) Transcript_4818:2718-3959(-)